MHRIFSRERGLKSLRIHFHVTPQGVALPPSPKYQIPSHYIENKHRRGSYGIEVNGKFVENVATLNVKRGVKNIIERSFILEEMLDNGEIGIVGAMYNIDTGKVEFYKEVSYIKDEKNPKFSVAELRH